jgi:hypothetical protein
MPSVPALPNPKSPPDHGKPRALKRGDRGDQFESVVALEQPNDTLNRVTAGMRSATIHKLLFDETEAAVILGVSSETMRVWRREGKGPPWVRLGDSKLVRYGYDGLVGFVATLTTEVA